MTAILLTLFVVALFVAVSRTISCWYLGTAEIAKQLRLLRQDLSKPKGAQP